jgi:hypothetical protein
MFERREKMINIRVIICFIAVVILMASVMTCIAEEERMATPPRFGSSQESQVISPEVFADRHVTFRISAPNAETV